MATFHSPSVVAVGQQVKATGGLVYSYYFSNSNAAWRYLKLYDKSSAPTIGTDTPVFTLGIAPSSAQSSGDLKDADWIFQNGIWVAATTGAPDADTGAPSANDIVCNFTYW